MTTASGPLFAHRHSGTRQHLEDLASEHLPPSLRDIAQPIEQLAHQLVDALHDGPRLTTGLHLLVQAKDALVRQRVADLKGVGFEPVNTPEPELVAAPRAKTADERIVERMQRDARERGVTL